MTPVIIPQPKPVANLEKTTPFLRVLTETLQAFAIANAEDLGFYTLTEGDIREGFSHALSPEAIQDASRRLLEIFKRDFRKHSHDLFPIDPGAEDYIIRAVAEALIGNLEVV